MSGSSSRRRWNVADATAAAAAAATRDSSPWASLHEDLVSLIGWRVLAGDLRDYIRFRAVCPHWRSSTTCPRGRGIVDPRFHPRRWMLFPEGHGLHPGHGKLGGYVRFFSLSTGAFVRVRLPIFRDHCVLDSVDGILLLQRDQDTAVRLLHPFTGDIAEFPPLETFLPYVCKDIRAACISVGADGVVKVMMSISGMKNLCFATCGDQQWRISSWWRDMCSDSVPLSFQGKFYMLHRPEDGGEPEVLQVDPPQAQQEDMDLSPPKLIAKCLSPPKLIAKCPATTESASCSWYDLVECNSEILVVISRYGEDMQFSLYRLADLMLERTVPLKCIGGSTLFLSKRSLDVSSEVFVCKRSLHVSSEAFPTIVADTIVVWHMQKNYLAQYHLISGTLSAASDGCATGIANLSPCSIIYHIFTCCFREYWNKGQIMCHGTSGQWRVKRKWPDGA